MGKHQRCDPSPAEQHVPDHGHLELRRLPPERPGQDRIVIVGGKRVLHAGVEIVNAVDAPGRFLGSGVTPSKSNEIPAARQLLGGLTLSGEILLADAMHTQDQTAQQMLFEGSGNGSML